jgi:hypothetical protein
MSNEWLNLFSESVQKEKTDSEPSGKLDLPTFIEGSYLPDSRIFLRECIKPIDELIKGNREFILPVSIRKYGRIFLRKELDPEAILFIDTETTGLSRSQGTFIFMLGIGQIKGDNFYLRQYFIEEMSEEIILFEHIYELLQKTELFVSYNGKSFDIPLLQSRLTINRINLQIKEVPHYDLLPLARRIWRSKLDSFSLANLEKHLFDKIRDEEFDVPGYLIPSLYAEYQESGNPEALINVFYHNEDDILSLCSLYSIQSSAFLNREYSLQAGIFNLLEIGRVYEQIMESDLAGFYYERAYQNKEERSDFYFAGLCKKERKLDKAVEIWQGMNDLHSAIELAKYHEKNKAYNKAMSYLKKAEVLLFMSENCTIKKIEDIKKRIIRIEEKQAKQENAE